MRVPRELLLILAFLVVAAGAAQQAASGRAEEQPLSLDSYSVAPGGARALYLWLESLGYTVEKLEYRDFRPGEDTGVLLMLAPVARPNKDDLEALQRWVERGGTLIVAASVPTLPLARSLQDRPVPGLDAPGAVLGRFDLALYPAVPPQVEAAPTQPLLLRPPVTSTRIEATSYISGSSNLVPYLGDPERPAAAGVAAGQGWVYVLASTHALSNGGLGEADNAALLLNWLPAPEAAATIAFDEVHHGRAEARSLPYLMVREPWGWAVLYIVGMAFLYLALGGRRFGRPVPATVDTRRPASEYVVSLAGLLRRGGKRQWVAEHYERELRRQLTAACYFDPGLDTPAAASRLHEVGPLAPGLEGRDAGRVLLELHDGVQKGLSEAQLVSLAAETDRIVKACTGRRR